MMGPGNSTDELRRDSRAQIDKRSYPVSEVSEPLGVSKHSLGAWKRKFANMASGETEMQSPAEFERHQKVRRESV